MIPNGLDSKARCDLLGAAVISRRRHWAVQVARTPRRSRRSWGDPRPAPPV